MVVTVILKHMDPCIVDWTASNVIFISDRKSSLMSQMESFRKRSSKDDSGGFVRHGSLERPRSGSTHEQRGGGAGGAGAVDDELAQAFDNFRPVTLTVSSFFKQVTALRS